MSETEYTLERLEQLIVQSREWLAAITDQQLSEMQEHERAFVFKLRAAQHAFDRGDSAELERLMRAQLAEVQRVLGGT